jgi:hypothetical protein
MKIQIVTCLSELVKEKFGEDRWGEILRLSDMDTNDKYLQYVNGLDIDDTKVMEIIKNTCRVLKITLEQAADAFGEYWVCTYAPKVYKMYYGKFANAREFIMGMDFIHDQVTKNIENAHPPRFDIKELDANRISVHYKSARKMMDFYVGLAKGIGKYFNTPLIVKKIDEEFVEITFPN